MSLRTAFALLALALSFSLTDPSVGRAESRGSVRPTVSKPSVEWRRRNAILVTFGKHGRDALKVAECESGTDPNAVSRDGRYKGAFQMGPPERRTYGHGRGMWAQARAAYRYFVASGSDWSPWSCKP